ncbi:MAG: hypothetical protein ACFCU4_04585 [Puniceicoccaceae bacterium]
MKPDIQKRLKDEFGDDFYSILKEINEWDAQTKSLLDDRLLRSAIFLSRGKIESFLAIKEASRRDYRDVLWQAEYDGEEERIRDFNRPFGSECDLPIQQ